MNVTTLIFLGLAVVWAIVLLPEVLRKLAGSRRSDSIRSFNQQLSVLDRSGGRGADRASNVIDLRSHSASGHVRSEAPRSVSPAVRKRRQEVLTVLGSAAVLTLLCTVAFGGPFLALHIIADLLLIAYAVALNQVNQANAGALTTSGHRNHLLRPDDELRTATVGRSMPAPRRIAN